MIADTLTIWNRHPFASSIADEFRQLSSERTRRVRCPKVTEPNKTVDFVVFISEIGGEHSATLAGAVFVKLSMAWRRRGAFSVEVRQGVASRVETQHVHLQGVEPAGDDQRMERGAQLARAHLRQGGRAHLLVAGAQSGHAHAQRVLRQTCARDACH